MVAARFSWDSYLCPTLPSALEVGELLFHQVFRYYNIPEDIISDRGPQLISGLVSFYGEARGDSESHLRLPPTI